jgi:dihydroneopterin aldolase
VNGPARVTDTVELTGLCARGFHGVFGFEREEGQEFVVDLVLHVDTRPAAASDDLADAVDYGVVAQRVHDVVAGEPVDLIETLAARIAATCLVDERVAAVEVAVHKPQAPVPVPFGDVVVRVRRDRDSQEPA